MAIAFFVVSAAGALAHPAADPKDEHTRIMHDCADDYGWHGGNQEPGHGLVALDVAETTRDGEEVLLVYLTIDHRDPNDPGDETSEETWETIEFSTPHKDVSLTLNSQTDGPGEDTDDGEDWFTKTAGNVDPHDLAIEDPVEHGGDGGSDPGRFALEVYLAWDEVQAEEGDQLEDFSILGEYDAGAGRTDGDEMTKDGDRCDPQEDDDFVYTAPYTVQQSDWTPSDDGSDGDNGDGSDGDSNDPPRARFAADCWGRSCDFDASESHDPDGDSLSYEWDLGDDDTARGETTAHRFDDPGTYTIELTVDDGSATDTADETLTVDPLPEPHIETHCNGLTCSFNGSGTTDDGAVTSLSWAFGDGETAEGSPVNHTYDEEGTHEVTFNATDDSGQWNTTSKSVEVGHAPRLDPTVDPNPVLVNRTVSFDAGVSHPNGEVDAVTWTIGGDDTLTGRQVEHVFAAPGAHEVILQARDSQGNTNQTALTVEVDAPPALDARIPSEAVKGKEAKFAAYPSDHDGSVAEVAWTFGDGTEATSRFPTHTWPSAGNYTVTVNVTDDEGYSTKTSQPLRVWATGNQAPFTNATIEPEHPEPGETVRFRDHSTDEGGEVVRRTWTFPSGENKTGQTVEHTFQEADEHTVEFVVEDDNGTATRTKLVVPVDERADENTSSSPKRPESSEDEAEERNASEPSREQTDDPELPEQQSQQAGQGDAGTDDEEPSETPAPGALGVVAVVTASAAIGWRRR